MRRKTEVRLDRDGVVLPIRCLSVWLNIHGVFSVVYALIVLAGSVGGVGSETSRTPLMGMSGTAGLETVLVFVAEHRVDGRQAAVAREADLGRGAV